MSEFLQSRDIPNWVVLLVFALAWMVSALANWMRGYAESKFIDAVAIIKRGNDRRGES